MTFGEKLKLYRVKNNQSQEELAKILGTTKQVISRYEKNQRVPKITTVNEYAKILNIRLEYLLNNEIIWSSTPIQQVSIIGDGNSGQSIINANQVTTATIGDMNPQEKELIRIYKNLPARQQTELLHFAYELEDKNIK